MAEVKEVVEEKKEKKSIFSRIWNGLFRLHGDDFEKRLQYISKEESTLVARMQRRSMRWRRTARNLIIVSILLELVAMGYAIMTTRSMSLDWKVRALRVLPVFLLPGLSSVLYFGLLSFTKMCDHRDQKSLEKLRAERQAKIDELKERTNYYTTQQLIQRYDPDPAAKAAAASVLASKLGADSGLKVFIDEWQLNAEGTGKSSDFELVQSSGLRKRNQSAATSPGGNVMHNDKEMLQYTGSEVSEISLPSELVVEHHNPVALSPPDGGWIARLAAMLVGEDPTQSYALVCGNCHMHNGLARKEDFPFITYYCPHCRTLNKPGSSDEHSSEAGSPDKRSSTTLLADSNLMKQRSKSRSENVSASNTPDAAESKAREKTVAEGPASS